MPANRNVLAFVMAGGEGSSQMEEAGLVESKRMEVPA